jgi:hypothetical protein
MPSWPIDRPIRAQIVVTPKTGDHSSTQRRIQSAMKADHTTLVDR